MWITHLTQAERDFYTKQPTAKKMHEKMLKNGTHIKEGDKAAAAAFIAQREAQKTAPQQGRTGDVVELSAAGQALKQKAAPEGSTAADAQFIGQGQGRKLRFATTAALHEAVKNGFVELDGQQYFLTDDMKRALSAKDKAMQKLQQGISVANQLRQQAVQAQRTSESMQKASQAQSRLMQTVTRIMHGRKVSMADEKELAEASPELYSMAKAAAALERHRLSQREKEEDDKINAQNDRDREWERSPSAIPDAVETPVPEYSVEVDFPEGGLDLQA